MEALREGVLSGGAAGAWRHHALRNTGQGLRERGPARFQRLRGAVAPRRPHRRDGLPARCHAWRRRHGRLRRSGGLVNCCERGAEPKQAPKRLAAAWKPLNACCIHDCTSTKHWSLARAEGTLASTAQRSIHAQYTPGGLQWRAEGTLHHEPKQTPLQTCTAIHTRTGNEEEI